VATRHYFGTLIVRKNAMFADISSHNGVADRQ
jgi:hypothetical protein